jgi:hypothetical protein
MFALTTCQDWAMPVSDLEHPSAAHGVSGDKIKTLFVDKDPTMGIVSIQTLKAAKALIHSPMHSRPSRTKTTPYGCQAAGDKKVVCDIDTRHNWPSPVCS